MTSFVASWSGGKDSCFAFMKAKEQGLAPAVILNMMNENGMISRSHAIPKSILHEQADALGLPIVTKPASWNDYETIFIETLKNIRDTYQIDSAVFGDIDLQAHRDWEEKVCAAVGLQAILPLWQHERKHLVLQMIRSVIEAYIVSCNERMGEVYLGKRITGELIGQLEEISVDPCGENGEYHTLVVNAPVFNRRLDVSFGRTFNHKGYWFIEMNSANR
jgi:uncharacterized protein (TIGR00290 family)